MPEPFAFIPLNSILKTLAGIIILLLLLIFAIIHTSRKRADRIEKKIDAIGQRLGIEDLFNQFDEDSKRTGRAPLEPYEGSSSRRGDLWTRPGSHGFTQPSGKGDAPPAPRYPPPPRY